MAAAGLAVGAPLPSSLFHSTPLCYAVLLLATTPGEEEEEKEVVEDRRRLLLLMLEAEALEQSWGVKGVRGEAILMIKMEKERHREREREITDLATVQSSSCFSPQPVSSVRGGRGPGAGRRERASSASGKPRVRHGAPGAWSSACGGGTPGAGCGRGTGGVAGGENLKRAGGGWRGPGAGHRGPGAGCGTPGAGCGWA
ncbi:uncharacterized protein [Miscanthus floridulus]|uniref:uncharacterized protein n=1 Tax=Miscanthus floridulus TaxID=154761 RepID=UPI0034594A13